MTNPKWNATHTNTNNHSYEDYNACILLNNYGIYLMEIGSLKESIEIFRSTIDCFNTILLNEKQQQQQQQQQQDQDQKQEQDQDQKQEHPREQQYTPNNDAARQRNRNTTTLGNNNGYNSCHNMNSDDSDKSDNGSNTTARIVAKRLLPSEFREQCILNPPHTGMESSSSTSTSSYDKEKDSTSSTNEDPRASTFSCCCCCCCSSSNVCQSSSNDRIRIDSPVRIHCGYENCTCQHRITIDPTIGCAIALYNFGLAHVGLLQCLQQEQQEQQQQQQEQSQAVHCNNNNNNKQTCQLIAMITRLLLLSNSLIESTIQKIRIGNDRKNHGNNNNIRGLVLFSFTIQCVLARVRQQQSMINETTTENNNNSSTNENNNNNNTNTALDLELRKKVSLLYVYLSKEENGFVENNEFTIDFIATVA